MKVAHLVISGDLAGGQRVALQIAHALRERGDETLFLSPTRGTFTDRAEADGFRVLGADVRRLHHARGALVLARLLRAERIDLLHTHTLAAANALARLAARAAGIPVVSHLHIENRFRPATEIALSSADNLTARLTARLIAVSDDTRRAYERQGYPRRIDVVHNGVTLDGTPARALRRELGLKPDAPLVGEVGRLCDVKGQRELIEAIAQVPDASVVLIGSDLERDGAYQSDSSAMPTHSGSVSA